MYGTSTQRLEGAVSQVARHLGIEADVWSNPTGMILSFPDHERGAAYSMTRVIRLEPGEQNLGLLAAADATAEDVLAGRLDVRDAEALNHAAAILGDIGRLKEAIEVQKKAVRRDPGARQTELLTTLQKMAGS